METASYLDSVTQILLSLIRVCADPHTSLEQHEYRFKQLGEYARKAGTLGNRALDSRVVRGAAGTTAGSGWSVVTGGMQVS